MNLALDDVTVMRNITKIRTEVNACTIRELGRRMQMNESTLRLHITDMRSRGVISINEVPGSLAVTELGQAMIDHQLNGDRITELMAAGVDENEAILMVYPQLRDNEQKVSVSEGDRDESCQTSAPDPVEAESPAPVSPAPVKKRAYKKRAAKKRAPRARDQ